MQGQDLIWLILFLVFFVFPIIRSIIEGLAGGGGGGGQQKGRARPRSREEVREYLERMRTNYAKQQQGSSQYQPPSTRRGIAEAIPVEDEDEDFSRIEKIVERDIYSRGQFDTIEKTVEEDIYSRGQFDRFAKSNAVEEKDAYALSNKKTTPAQKATTNSARIEELILKKNYSELQKAVLLSEVIREPVSVRGDF